MTRARPTGTSSAAPELLALAAQRLELSVAGDDTDDLDRPHPAGLLHRAAGQPAPRQPSHVASYRDSLKLLLAFAQQATGKPPTALDWADLDAELITAFLEHLETGRHNTTGPVTCG